jgi:two-component system OmpR family response regulator
MRILLVEDDRMIGAAVMQALQDAAYAVDWVTDGQMALNTLTTSEHEMLLLDLGLPQQDGLAVLRQIRQRNNPIPVLILTARDSVESRVAGLDLGADDYLVKPFEITELLARMRAVLRRHAGATQPALSNGSLTLDLATHELSCDGQTHALSAREFALMQALLQRPGAILSRAELEQRIYGWNDEIDSNAVEVIIHGVRRKLGAAAIKNVRGAGWMVAK